MTIRSDAFARFTALIALALTWSAEGLASAVAEPPDATSARGSTFALLIGYPKGPPGSALQELSAVGDDVERMIEFLRPLQPQLALVHLQDRPQLAKRLGQTPRAPTLAAIETSVDDLVAALRDAPEPRQIYVYYSGHGKRRTDSGRPRTQLYLAPDGGGPGYDGNLDADVLAEKILAPLGRYGTVHFIADACQSWYLLEVRGAYRRRRVLKQRPAARVNMLNSFAARLPGVGALLATNGGQVTYEDPELGGLFSHALRSAAIGPADLNRDGVITYRELGFAVEWILKGRSGMTAPGVLPPGQAQDAVFIDWNGAPGAVKVQFGALAGYHRLLTRGLGFYATLNVGAEPLPVWLPAGQTFFALAGAIDQPDATWWQFEADNGSFINLRGPEPSESRATKGASDLGLFANAISITTLTEAPQVEVPWLPSPYLAIGANVGLGGALYGAPGSSVLPSASIGIRLGSGRHQLVVEPNWSRWMGSTSTAALPDQSDVNRKAPQSYALDLFGVRAGYGHVLIDGQVELTAYGAIGGGAAFKSTENDDRIEATGTIEGHGGLMAHLPMPAGSPFAARIDLGVTYKGLVADRRSPLDLKSKPYDPGLDHALQLVFGIGFEWEEPL